MSRLFGPVTQNGYLVPDLDAAMAYWSGRVGVGPFFVFPRISYAELFFRGQPAQIEIVVAIAYSGDMQIELIQPLSDTPSVYREFTDAGHAGLHHLGVLSGTYDADLARLTAAGHAVVQGGRVGRGTGFAYFAGDPNVPGGMIELIEASPGMLRLFARIKAAANDWDGGDPVRRL